MRRARTAALIFRRCSHTSSYVARGKDGPPSTWHMTQWLLSTRTISRSNSTVVFTVSCGEAERGQETPITRATTMSKTSSRGNIALLLRADHDVERGAERVESVVPAELGPGAISSGLRHQ